MIDLVVSVLPEYRADLRNQPGYELKREVELKVPEARFLSRARRFAVTVRLPDGGAESRLREFFGQMCRIAPRELLEPLGYRESGAG